jgi:uncharacterized membrane protein
MGDIRKQRFIQTLRSSPRRRRRVAWLTGSLVALTAFIVVSVLVVPNTAGEPKPSEEAVPKEYGTGLFWTVASAVVIGFFVALAVVLVRFLWRLHKDETDAARPGAYTFPNPRNDRDQAIRTNTR